MQAVNPLKSFSLLRFIELCAIPQHTPLFASQEQADGCDNQSFNEETFTKHGKKILKVTVERWGVQSICKIAVTLKQWLSSEIWYQGFLLCKPKFEFGVGGEEEIGPQMQFQQTPAAGILLIDGGSNCLWGLSGKQEHWKHLAPSSEKCSHESLW